MSVSNPRDPPIHNDISYLFAEINKPKLDFVLTAVEARLAQWKGSQCSSIEQEFHCVVVDPWQLM